MGLFNQERLSLRTAIRLRLLNLLRKRIFNPFKVSYSQIGEDIAIEHILSKSFGLKSGFYVDVGCNHPIRLSNTFNLYLKGWNGITIDLNNELISLHKTERKKDLTINTAISNLEKEVQVFNFNSDLVNTIDSDFAELISDEFDLLSSHTIKTNTLDHILSENDIDSIDLLCIDVEGHDFEVLQSLDLIKYRPKLIVIEMHDFKLEEFEKHPIYKFLREKNYLFYGYLIANGFFIDINNSNHA